MEHPNTSSEIDVFIRKLFKDISLGSLPVELARSSDSDIAEIINDKQQTLLHVAAGYGRKRLVEVLIAKGADVDATDNEGQAPLHYACNHAHNTIARLLIDAGADVNLTDMRGWSPLDFALARKDNAQQISPKYWEVVELLLLCGADPYKKSLSGKNCFDRVKDSEQRLCIRLLRLKNRLEDCDDLEARIETINRHIRDKDFFELIKKGDEDIEVIKEILTPKFIRSRLQTLDNITPLHRAAGYNHVEVAKLLLKNGADVNATDDHGQVPLHNAARYGHVEMIELLLGEGCIINTQDIDGMSPIHVAASSRSFSACLRLIDSGADIALRNSDGKLPYDLAETDDVREVLRQDETGNEMIPASSSQSHYGKVYYMGFSDDNATLRPDRGITSNDDNRDELMLDSRSHKRLFDNPNHAIKKIRLYENDSKYRLIEQRMRDTIKYHAGDMGGLYSSYEILTVEQILHEKVWQKYKKRCEILDLENVPRAERLLFHGSGFIDKIQKYGFDHRYAQPYGMFGAGIYFAAHSSKSNQYTFGFGKGCPLHKDKSCYECERKMIYAQVALGESFVSREAMPSLSHPPPGYWSVSGEPEITEGLQYPEYVIYDGHQAYPLFVITYRIKP